jgi:hypothetical protein
MRWWCRASAGYRRDVERVEVELFGDGGNSCVVRMPGRQFRGILVQGDSMSIILEQLAEIEQRLKDASTQEALEAVTWLADDVSRLLNGYEYQLAQHAIRLPYAEPPHRDLRSDSEED